MEKKSIPFEISTQTTLFDLLQQMKPKMEDFWCDTQLLQYAESQCCIVVKSIRNLKTISLLRKKNIYVVMPLFCLTNIFENLRKLTTEKQKLIGITHKKRQIYKKKITVFTETETVKEPRHRQSRKYNPYRVIKENISLCINTTTKKVFSTG